MVVGLLLNFFGVNPIIALYYAAWLNGIIALPLMIIIMLIGNNQKIVGSEIHPKWVKWFGWLAVVAMTLGVLATIFYTFGSRN